jgi:type I restriction enzyme S subunit
MKVGWEVKRLGDLAKINYGYTEKATFEDIGTKFLRITDIQDDGVNWETVPYCKISDIDFEKYQLSSGDIVFARTGATTGKSYLVYNPPKSVFASYLIKVHIAKKELTPQYLYCFFQTKAYWDKIKEGVSGSAQGGFNASKLADLIVPIPPLPEQQCIVSILDEAFIAIDQAKENLRKNLQNAKDLFQSELNSIFKRKGEGWVEKKLGDICETKPQKREARDKLKDNDLVTFLPMEDLGIESQTIKPSQERTLSEVSGSYTYFANNDVLLAKITPCFENGKIGIASNLKNGIGFGSSEYMVFRSKGAVIPEWIFYFLTRKSFREEGRLLMTGAVGHKRVSKDWIENYIIPFPNSQEMQQQIVDKLDTLSAETKKLEVLYQQKIINLEILKKSVLQDAFSGKLNLNYELSR